MSRRKDPYAPFTVEERELLRPLDSPDKIQAFLDTVDYSADPIYRAPRSVMRDRKAHCVDGALFAACALRAIGQRARIIELRAVRDDDHLLALYERDGHIGAVAKSNFVGLRYREPVFRSVRELALSYFHDYYNVAGEKTMRAYSVPLDLRAFDADGWMFRDEAVDAIIARLEASRHYTLLTRKNEASLVPMDERALEAGLLGANQAGLYQPE